VARPSIDGAARKVERGRGCGDAQYNPRSRAAGFKRQRVRAEAKKTIGPGDGRDAKQALASPGAPAAACHPAGSPRRGLARALVMPRWPKTPEEPDAWQWHRDIPGFAAHRGSGQGGNTRHASVATRRAPGKADGRACLIGRVCGAIRCADIDAQRWRHRGVYRRLRNRCADLCFAVGWTERTSPFRTSQGQMALR
jgi:hypothetical protein